MQSNYSISTINNRLDYATELSKLYFLGCGSGPILPGSWASVRKMDLDPTKNRENNFKNVFIVIYV